jgi:hypothetical protein
MKGPMEKKLQKDITDLLEEFGEASDRLVNKVGLRSTRLIVKALLDHITEKIQEEAVAKITGELAGNEDPSNETRTESTSGKVRGKGKGSHVH